MIEVLISGTYRTRSGSVWFSPKDFSQTVSVKCNVAGCGEDTVLTSGGGNVCSVDATYAITKIEGRVRPVN